MKIPFISENQIERLLGRVRLCEFNSVFILLDLFRDGFAMQNNLSQIVVCKNWTTVKYIKRNTINDNQYAQLAKTKHS